MRDEWSFRDEAVNLHGIEPPIYFPAQNDAAFLRHSPLARVRLDTLYDKDIVSVEAKRERGESQRRNAASIRCAGK